MNALLYVGLASVVAVVRVIEAIGHAFREGWRRGAEAGRAEGREQGREETITLLAKREVARRLNPEATKRPRLRLVRGNH